MYQLSTIIPNESETSLISEVAFHPGGSMFAVSFTDNDEVRVFDAQTHALIRVYKNPDAEFDKPHGVLMTDNYMLVSNGHSFTRPSTLNIYRVNDPSDKPVSTYATPYQHLREAHSLAIHNDILIISYCESESGTGGIVSYRFDDKAGKISGPIDIRESCFKKYGDAKGITFSRDATKVYLSFNSQLRLTGLKKYLHRFTRAKHLLHEKGVMAFARMYLPGTRASSDRKKAGKPILKNGLAIVDINSDGSFPEEPIKVLLRDKFCRLENINIVDDTAVIADTINNTVTLYDVASDPYLENPVQSISENMALPHGAKLSPDKKLLVVTNFGLNVKHQVIHWRSWASPRKDRILVYELQGN